MWQPIETAPKDGTEVLIVDETGWVLIGWWNKDDPIYPWAFMDKGFLNGFPADRVTHWMPLPEPPQ